MHIARDRTQLLRQTHRQIYLVTIRNAYGMLRKRREDRLNIRLWKKIDQPLHIFGLSAML